MHTCTQIKKYIGKEFTQTVIVILLLVFPLLLYSLDLFHHITFTAKNNL